MCGANILYVKGGIIPEGNLLRYLDSDFKNASYCDQGITLISLDGSPLTKKKVESVINTLTSIRETWMKENRQQESEGNCSVS
jgi:hypothetical protein